MARILIVYSTTDGHTRVIGERLRGVLEHAGNGVEMVCVTQAAATELRNFDRIVIGASIRYGRHNPLLVDFVKRNANQLNSRPSAFFSVSVAARKPGNRRPETNPYMQAFLRKVSWRPQQLAVFAGRIDYPRYGFFDRTMIRLIMLLTGGPTARDAVVEFTDWNQVEAFGEQLCLHRDG